MCGIYSKFGVINTTQESRNKYLEISKRIRHRGPDWNGIYITNKAVITHERLSIVGVDNGSQPIIYKDDKTGREIVLSINGEIYNYKELYDLVVQGKYTPLTKSDCEVIIYLYLILGDNFINLLDGVFSFVLYDKLSDVDTHILVARDPIGINPLFVGFNKLPNSDFVELSVASEHKCLDYCDTVEIVLPGYRYKFDNNIINNDNTMADAAQLYYEPNWREKSFNNFIDISDDNYISLLKNINLNLTKAVEKRLMSEVPFGVLLSGGLDSSLITSITSRLIKQNPEKYFCNNLHSFSIGLPNSPDLKAAKKVANFLGTIHHELNFTIQEGIDCLRDLIYHLETCDVTTIRASTPMFLLSRKIKSYGIKMVLSGEGADEIMGGYLYFHQAPNDKEFHDECVKRINDLHYFDCLRANKSTMAWGLEVRVPFLDKQFLENSVRIHPKNKCNKFRNKPMEKLCLRDAFNSNTNPYLPSDILYRQKEQFTDGVGYSWLDSLLEHCKKSIDDNEFGILKDTYNVKNKEEAYYLKIYNELFPNRLNLVKRWIPKTQWDGVSYDPSGRAQKVHNKNEEFV